jgi:alpha-methylacyl-CoA racemase
MARLHTFLSGVKVLDLSQYIPGPMATLLLADMGADVLKIEPPQGDQMRELGPRNAAGEPVFYAALNAGKRVCRMNLKEAGERARFLDIARDYDVLIEGFRPGVMARLGLGYDQVKAVNPGLIWCSISGFGARGAEAATAAHDGNYLAASGILDRNGANGPEFFDPPISDVAGSLFAALAILGALHGRQRDGRGCAIDLALADVPMPLQLMQIAAYGANGTVPVRRSTYLNGGAAYYRIYSTADGRHVMLGAVERKFWTAFCEAAERPHWIARQDEPLPQSSLAAEVQSFFAGLTLSETTARFDGVDCCLSPVLTLAEAMSSQHVSARGLVRAGGAPGDLQALFPALFDGEAPRARTPVATYDPASARPSDKAAE